MIRIQIAGRRPKRAGLLAVLALALIAAMAQAAILVQDAGDDAAAGPTAGWEAFAVTSARSSVSAPSRGVTVQLAPGDRATFSRAADLMPSPTTALITFDVSVSDVVSPPGTSQMFRLGWDFGTSNTDEADVRTYAQLGLRAVGSAFQLRDVVGAGSSALFQGTQAVSWALNNSGGAVTYAAPNGTVESLANDRMDVWVGRDKVFDDVATTNPDGRSTDLKWVWSRGSGMTHFDHFLIRTLDEATALSQAN